MTIIVIIHSHCFRSTAHLTAPELLSFFNEFTLWSCICLYSSLTNETDLFVSCPGIRIFQSISHSCGSSLKPLQRLINLLNCCTQASPALKPAGNTTCLHWVTPRADVQELQFPCNQSTNAGIVMAHHVSDALPDPQVFQIHQSHGESFARWHSQFLIVTGLYLLHWNALSWLFSAYMSYFPFDLSLFHHLLLLLRRCHLRISKPFHTPFWGLFRKVELEMIPGKHSQAAYFPNANFPFHMYFKPAHFQSRWCMPRWLGGILVFSTSGDMKARASSRNHICASAFVSFHKLSRKYWFNETCFPERDAHLQVIIPAASAVD